MIEKKKEKKRQKRRGKKKTESAPVLSVGRVTGNNNKFLLGPSKLITRIYRASHSVDTCVLWDNLSDRMPSHINNNNKNT